MSMGRTGTRAVGPPAGRSARAGRQIGPIGTVSRIVGGLTAIALPVALHGLTVADAMIALVGLPLIVTIAAPALIWLFGRAQPAALHTGHGICSAPGCSLIAVMVLANSGMAAVTGGGGTVSLWVWLGSSMLLAAARGYGGCEVLGIWKLITGRDDQIGCILYTPIDAAEARRSGRRRAAQAGG
jgi:hypothetical protein